MDFGTPFTSIKSLELIPTGIPSLDAIIGGGFPVGSIVLLNEDNLATYSDMFLKVFLSQGIVRKDDVMFASCDVSPDRFIRTLPQESSSNVNTDNVISNNRLQIAWRYENNPVLSTSFDMNKSIQGNSFNFKGYLTEDIINSANINYWPTKDSSSTCDELLDCIYETLITTNNLNELMSKKGDKRVLRLGIHNLGSFFWKDSQTSLPLFLFKLRSIIHHSHAVAFITFPKHLIQRPELIYRCEQMSDSVIELVSFGSDKNPLFNDLNGFIKFTKLCSINSLCPLMRDSVDWAFKLTQKKLIIEKLRLPPESSASVQREQDVSTGPICSQISGSKLDF